MEYKLLGNVSMLGLLDFPIGVALKGPTQIALDVPMRRKSNVSMNVKLDILMVFASKLSLFSSLDITQIQNIANKSGENWLDGCLD